MLSCTNPPTRSRDIRLASTEFWLTFFDPNYDTIPRELRDDIVKKQRVVERLLEGY